MFYREFKSPAIIKTGNNIIGNIDTLLKSSHLFFNHKILITQQYLYDLYKDQLEKNDFNRIIFIKGADISETDSIITQIKGTDSLALAFGGGSVLDSVKYCASKCDIPYITVPSTLSNDAIYSAVSRLTVSGKKNSFGVQAPVGIIVDLEIIKKSPKELILAGVADLVSNLSAIQDWKLAYKTIHEPINELSFMLAKEAAMSMFQYKESDIFSDDFLFDLTNGLITSGLSMIISGNTRGTSGAEHLISHAIDEFFPERSTIHGLQVGWAHLYIEKNIRKNTTSTELLERLFNNMGLSSTINKNIKFSYEEFDSLIPLAKQIRNRYTIFNTITNRN
ncbi:iron-containing alcohol dehydrogenase [bacterium]|nr:iron-containing alcohol dehydrogenase [bacterium]